MINILLSTYNGEKYLSEQIDSILNQTYLDCKLIIRDDGSTDRTNLIIDEYCQKYKNKIVKLSDNLGNLGVIRSFELLLEQSDAEYFMFCDQDDVWLPHKIENSILKMKETEKEFSGLPIVVCSDLIVVDSNLKTISNSFWSHCRIAPQHLQTAQYMAVNNYAAGCTMFFNKQAKQISLPFGQHTTMHDAWIVIKTLANGGKIITLPQPQILYRQHGKNQIGASEIKYDFKYFSEKVTRMSYFLKNNYLNYKQAHEILGTSCAAFFVRRFIYILKR